jgi:large subunit ribosomal protein L20
MARAKRGFKARRRRKKVFDRAEGFFGRRNNCYSITAQAVDRAEAYAYVGRKRKKRDFRRLWITRINAAARQFDTTYSQLIPALKKAGIDMNRKMLAEIAVSDIQAFEQIVAQCKKAA